MTEVVERKKLAAAAKRAGYGRDALLIIARTSVPGLTPGETLNDEQIADVRLGVEILEACGYPADALEPIVDSYVARYADPADNWRYEFWRRMLSRAKANDIASSAT